MQQHMENKLQEILDNKPDEVIHLLTAEEQYDLKMYEAVVQSLKNEPQAIVPHNFSLNLVEKIQTRRDRRQTRILYVLFASIVLAAFFICSFLINTEVLQQLAAVIADYIWLFIFTVVVVVLVHVTDKKLTALRVTQH